MQPTGFSAHIDRMMKNIAAEISRGQLILTAAAMTKVSQNK